ncbi:MAG: hypothetical protein ABI304_02370 [Rudaea sp.]
MKFMLVLLRAVSIIGAMSVSTICVFATPALAENGGCGPVADAMMKLATTPRHSYTTDSNGGKTISGELITTNDSMFIKVDGKWASRKYSPEGEKKDQQEAWQSTKATCQRVSDKTVSGVATVVYNILNKTEDGTSSQKLWISTSTGLPLRAEIDLDADDKASTRHISMHYDYVNVQPPAGK